MGAKVRKAIIPAAGLGTRFLPATKAMPKELLPIVDKPTIQFIVEEAIASGIEQLLIVTGKGKRAIEDHFDRAFELEQLLREKEQWALLEQITVTANMDVHYIRQKAPRGLGDAIWCARHFIGDEPFAVLLGDDLVEADVPCTKQLMEQYERWQQPIIGVQHVPLSETKRYGIVERAEPLTERAYQIEELIEKPLNTTSTLAVVGRYILTPDIFPLLETLPNGVGGELQLTDALTKLSHKIAYQFAGKRYDVGEKLGYLTTAIEFALRDVQLREPLLQFLRNVTTNDER